jgi:HAE1 family hydrophobic/amphiphilic exporter-1
MSEDTNIPPRGDHQPTGDATGGGATASPQQPYVPATPPDASTTGRILALFVDRPVLTLMVSLTLLLVGALSFSRLPLRLVPAGLSSSSLNVWVPIQGSIAPVEIEEAVVRPMEEQLETIPGVKKISSRAGSGSARFTVEFDPDVPIDLATAEVRDRAQRAELEWPDEADRFIMWREDPSAAPLAFVQFLTPSREPEWDHLIDEVLRPRIESVDGVGRLDIWGIRDETLRIWFDRDALVKHRLDYGQILQRLGSENFTEPVGELDDGASRYLLRVDTKFRTEDEIRHWPVRTGLELGDIATIERVPSIRDRLTRYGTVPPPDSDKPFRASYTYTGIVRAASDTNQVDASQRLRAALEELRAEDPRFQELEWRFLFDQGEMIRSSLDTLKETSLQGAGLALVVLWLFLRNLRFTITIALAIPGALLIAGSQLFFSGGSLNLMTMAGMTLAVGMVVDNAVVVLENIQRLRGDGWRLRDACIEGAREVVLPLTMATSTTVVVLLPLIFMGGETTLRVTMGALGLPLSVALVGSLLVALLLLPSGIRNLGAGSPRPVAASTRPRSRLAAVFSRLSPVRAITDLNRTLLALSLRNIWTRLGAAAASVALMFSILVPLGALDFEAGGGGPFQGGDVTVNLELPRGFTLYDVDQEVRGYEDWLIEHKDRWPLDAISSRYDRDSIRFDITLQKGLPRERIFALGSEIKREWPRRPGITQVLRNAGGNESAGGGSEQKSQENFVVRLYGSDSEFLAHIALETRDRLELLPQVTRVEVGDIEGNDEVVVAVDRDRMQELGVDPEQVARVTGSGLRGFELTRFEERGREIPLIAQFDRDRNPSLSDLAETRVVSRRGGEGSFAVSSLADISQIRFEQALGSIERIDGRTQITLVGSRAKDVGSREMTRILQNVMSGLRLPRGYSWEEASASTDTRAQLTQLLQAGALSVVLVFLLMGVLFESLILPGAILITIPFALLGGYWSLYLFGGALDPLAGIGLLLLCGVVVNNGIVLLDAIERLRRERGLSRSEAILEGSRIRLRPIIMTAATTVFGLLPMAMFGESTGEGVSYVSMSIAVAGGLSFCTVFTTFLVPLMYTFFEDFANWLGGVWVVAGTGRGPAEAETAAEGA